MKIFKKILLALCILAVLACAVGVYAIAADTTEYTVAGGQELVDAYGEAEDKAAAVAAARTYFANVDVNAEGYEAYATAYKAMEASYITDVLLPIANAYASAVAGEETTLAEARAAAFDAAYATLADAYDGASNYADLSAAVAADAIAYIGDVLVPAANADYSAQGDYEHIYQNIAARQLLSFIKVYAVDKTSEAYADLAADVEAVEKAYEDRVAADQKALYDKATLSDYVNYPEAQYMVDFESEKVGTKNPTSITAHSVNASLPNDTANNANVCEVAEDENGNKYYHYWYNHAHYYDSTGKETTVSGKHNYWDMKWNATGSLVIEMDMSTEDVFPASMNFQSAMNSTGAYANASGRVFPQLFNLANGTFSTYDNTKIGTTAIEPITIENIFSAKEWTHFTLSINSKTGLMTVYLDYVEVGTWDSVNGIPLVDDYILYVLRLGQKNDKECSFCFDNFTVYDGEHPRDVDYLNKIAENPEDLLVFYGNVVANPDSSVSDKSLAVDKATLLMTEFYNSETQTFTEGTSQAVQDAVFAVLAVDKEELNQQVRAANLEKLKTKVAEFEVTQRLLSNTGVRTAYLDDIQDFIDNNQFTTTDPDFIAINAKIGTYYSYVDQDTAANAFVKAMNSFNLRFSYSSMARHYATATAAYEQMDQDYIYTNAADASTISDAISDYEAAATILAEETRKNNARKIIAYINKVDDFAEADWDANYEFINVYIVAARNIIKVGNYDDTVDGFDAAFATYNTMNSYFYNLLQKVHIATLQERVDIYNNTSSYIERIGSVNFMTQYLASNDIDYTNAEIISLVNSYEVMKSEVDQQKTEYDVLLNQNTERFASAVSIMQAFNDYATLKTYYDRATEYFYSMNIVVYDAEGVATLDVTDAIAAYHAIGEKLTAIEDASAALKNACEDYEAKKAESTATKNDTYLFLAACYTLADKADASIEGVSSALNTYKSALAAYNAEILPLNEEIAVATDAMCAVRSICNLKGIMSVIRSILY